MSALVWFGLSYSGLAFPALVWSGLPCSGLVLSVLFWSGFFCSDLFWSGLSCCSLFWSGLVSRILIWLFLLWSGLVCRVLVWPFLLWSHLSCSCLIVLWSCLAFCLLLWSALACCCLYTYNPYAGSLLLGLGVVALSYVDGPTSPDTSRTNHTSDGLVRLRLLSVHQTDARSPLDDKTRTDNPNIAVASHRSLSSPCLTNDRVAIWIALASQQEHEPENE